MANNVPKPKTRGKSQRHLIEPHRHLLGELPDKAVADIAGVSMWAVRGYRLKLGIPARGKGKVKRVAKRASTVARKRAGRTSPLDAYVHLLGTLTDKAVAAKAGVSVGSVYQYRRNRKIPSLRANRKAGVLSMPAVAVVEAPAAARAKPRSAAPKKAPVVVAAPDEKLAQDLFAFKVVFTLGHEGVVVGATLADAAARIEATRYGEVMSIARVGAML
jgi:hypothetical protein